MAEKIKIVIVGNGFGGIYTLKKLTQLLSQNKNIEICLVGDKNYFLFTPLLHEVATGGINPQNIIEPIRDIFKKTLTHFYLGKCEKIDPIKNTILVDNHEVPYNYLVLAPGAETNFYNIEGAEQNTFTLKTIEDAIKIKNQIITKMECASHTQDNEKRKIKLRFAVIGGGPTGVELVAEIEEFISDTFTKYYSKEIINDVSICLIDRGSELVSNFNKKIRDKSLKTLKNKKINIILNVSVDKIEEHKIHLSDGQVVEAETIIWVAGIKPANLFFSGAIDKDKSGRIMVNEYLQSTSYGNIYALGDTACFTQNNQALPALAQVAEKESGIVAENILRQIKNKPLLGFKYKQTGTLMSLGRWKAVGELSGITFSGNIAWWIWRTVYLSKLISFRKKIKVALDWTVNIFSSRDISQI